MSRKVQRTKPITVRLTDEVATKRQRMQ